LKYTVWTQTAIKLRSVNKRPLKFPIFFSSIIPLPSSSHLPFFYPSVRVFLCASVANPMPTTDPDIF
jgi:hypothetical protein